MKILNVIGFAAVFALTACNLFNKKQEAATTEQTEAVANAESTPSAEETSAGESTSN